MTSNQTQLTIFALVCSLATAVAQNNSAPTLIPFATEQVITEGDSAAVIAAKAAKVLPRPNQVAWMRLERTFFLHFGVNTFNEVEWGTGREEPAIFNPTQFDANQWMVAITNFGGKMIVLVAKHHDGFCSWPSRYTAHSVAASPWRGGKGDEVREVIEAAKSHGVKLAVYLSPADLYQLRMNPKNRRAITATAATMFFLSSQPILRAFKAIPAKAVRQRRASRITPTSWTTTITIS